MNNRVRIETTDNARCGWSDILFASNKIHFSRGSKCTFTILWIICLSGDNQFQAVDPSFMPRHLNKSHPSREPFLSEKEEPVLYICLSYCWVQDLEDVLKTKMSNSVLVVTKDNQKCDRVLLWLKVQNLWVDSLCILSTRRLEWISTRCCSNEPHIREFVACYCYWGTSFC